MMVRSNMRLSTPWIENTTVEHSRIEQSTLFFSSMHQNKNYVKIIYISRYVILLVDQI